MENTKFIFVRHAESIKNLKDITGGNGEKLTSYGLEQVQNFTAKLPNLIDTQNCSIISSSMVQAKQTAKIISDKLDVPFAITDELKPADMGVISGLTKQEIQQEFPEIYKQLELWRNQKLEACNLIIPGMEPPEIFWERILKYIKSICTGGVKIIVCTRSVFVLIYNYVHRKNPKPGGGYYHVEVNNCDTIAFELNRDGVLVNILANITSDNLK